MITGALDTSSSPTKFPTYDWMPQTLGVLIPILFLLVILACLFFAFYLQEQKFARERAARPSHPFRRVQTRYVEVDRRKKPQGAEFADTQAGVMTQTHQQVLS